MTDTFYTDHWKVIEDDRRKRYEQMFVWREGQLALLRGADLEPGMHVMDLGAGPGYFAGGLASIVGDTGRVHGVDLNARFVADANARASDKPNVEFHLVTDHQLPFDEASFDRVICKNVLEYVPDVLASLAEVRRVLKPGGKVHIIDSDWGFVIVEPWGKAVVDEFFVAASAAFNEPYIGRRASGYLARSGFTEVKVNMNPFVDLEGAGLNVLTNMASYIRTFKTMAPQTVDGLLDDARAAVERGEFLFCLPQFLVTGSRHDPDAHE
ncbi:MAG: methyltransferase domain-containing protein [Proteobacteria bacterium]|nr:methyltransferase domain-containing protein [Pseudomonadota bacterium]